MNSKIAVIGSGPTGIYTLKGLIAANKPVSITVFEVEADPGKGTPYHPDINDRAMLSNIASIELPPICETLNAWLHRQPDAELERLGVPRDMIQEREFYPRVVLGEFLQSQFEMLVEMGLNRGHTIDVKARHRVSDIALRTDEIALTVTMPDGERKDYVFDHVVMATGHDWPETTEIKPGYFMSPWPAPGLKTIAPGSVGILGTSLSAIDALITVSTAHGAFYMDSGGLLQYQSAPDTEAFHATMMSRKGLLPEADFYCPIPYAPLTICTEEAVDTLIASDRANLLDKVFELFRSELAACDPAYAAKIGLSQLTVETVASAYFAEREKADPFVWAAQNLLEAEQNKANRYTVQWRYAILRMHEVIARAVPSLDETDLKRFHKYFKTVFIDDYATVPHQSIQRLLALRRAGKLDIVALGSDSEISTEGVDHGAVVKFNHQSLVFDAFIDATGQASLSARDTPFPTLMSQGVVQKAKTVQDDTIMLNTAGTLETVRTDGIDLDSAFRLRFDQNLSNKLYCAAISFLLHKLPFVQGITSARDIGEVVSSAILNDLDDAPKSVESILKASLHPAENLPSTLLFPGMVTAQ